MTSSEYWAERFRQLTETQTLADDELIKELENLYKQAQAEIESKIARWYMKFAENNEISMSEAKKLLKADELEEFRWTVEEYIKHGEENIDDVFTKQLVNASSKVHISRYEALLTELRQTAEKIMGTQASKLTEHLKTAYSENYLHTAFEIQKGTGVGTYLGGVDERSLEQVVRKSWAVDGNNFSERIWKDRNSLVSEIDTQLKRNIALGKGPDEAVTAISKRFETSKSNAYRLVMTESAAISAKATKQCYDDLEVEEFEVLETLDAHTCEICGAMDGKHFPKSQYEIGVTVPPFHPRCRGTTVPYFDDMEGYGERAARDLDGNTFYVPADTTYEQWKQIQDDKYGAGSVDKEQKFIYSKSSDYQQYKRYVDRLGEDSVGSFESFRKMKLIETQKFHDLELRYRYKGIDDRLLDKLPTYRIHTDKNNIPDEYNDCARMLDARSKEVIFKYTDGGSGCAEINTYAATGKAKTSTTAQDVQNLHKALDKMYLPYDTVVFRGTKKAYVEGLDSFENEPIKNWKNQPVRIKSFSSTSLFRDTAYSGEVEMTILVPKNKIGAGYVNEISHHHLTEGYNDEYEVVLQNNSKYAIIEAQHYKDKLFLVVEWLGG